MSVNRNHGTAWFASDNLIAWGLALSLVAHLAAYGGYRAAKHFGWFDSRHLPELFKSMAMVVAEAKKFQAEHPPQSREEQLIFVETDPTAAVPEPPKETKNYSAHNSLAANPDPQIETETPKIDGKQTHVPKAEDVARTKQFPLQPTPPKPTSTEAPQDAKAKPAGGPAPGDLAMAKPAAKPGDLQVNPDNGDANAATHKRPRRLEDLSPQQLAMLGQKMKQDGGTQRHRVIPSFDAKGSTFGEYDAAFIRAVSEAWHNLVDEKDFARNKIGKVVIDFHLNFNGTVSDVQIIENTVDMTLEIPCRRAITDPAPFAVWPSDMRRLIGADFREIRFSFFYD